MALKEEIHRWLEHQTFRCQGGSSLPRFYESSTETEVVVVEGGIGRQKAEATTIQTIESYHPSTIISAGFAGGAREGLRSGDLLLCQRLHALAEAPRIGGRLSSLEDSLESDHNLLDMAVKALKDARVPHQRGACLTAPQFVADAPLKRWIGSSYLADVIDMESYWVGRTARAKGISLLALRSVLDPVEVSLPAFVSDVVTAQGKGSRKKALRYAVSRPAQIPELFRLSRQAHAAQETLSQALGTIISSLKEEVVSLSSR